MQIGLDEGKGAHLDNTFYYHSSSVGSDGAILLVQYSYACMYRIKGLIRGGRKSN